MDYKMRLSIDGMGIVLFSTETMSYVCEGTDFMMTEFMQAEHIAEHINKGDITGFCTGSGGDFDMHFLSGSPEAGIEQQYPISAKLGLEVKGGSIQFCDLFWLTKWDTNFPEDQIIKMPSGFYEVTIFTKCPESGYWGEDQTILIYFNKVDKLPELSWTNVPYLYTEDEN